MRTARKTKAKPKTRFKIERSPRAPAALYAAIGAYLFLRIVVSLFDGGVLFWGLDHARYLPGSADILLALLLPAALLIPKAGDAAASLAEAAAKPLSGRAHYPAAALGIAAAVILPLLAPVESPLLGDGSHFLSEIFRITADPDYPTSLVKPTSFLAGHTLRWLALAFDFHELRIPFVIAGAASSVLLVLGFFMFMKGEKPNVILLLTSLVTGGGGTLFFFGYIEVYALSYVFAALYLLASWRVFRTGGGAVTPGVLLLLAVLFGGAALYLLPSYLFLLAVRKPHILMRMTPRRFAIALAGIQAVLLAGLYAIPVAGGDALADAAAEAYVLPLSAHDTVLKDGRSGGRFGYTVFSGAHIRDIPNVYALNAGAALAVLIGMLFLKRKAGDAVSNFILFFASAAFSGFLTTFFGNAVFGLARDWDLTAVAVLPAIFLAAALLLRAGEKGGFLRTLTPALAAASLSTVWIWVRVNADGDAAANRFEVLLDGYRRQLVVSSTHAGLEHLSKYYIKTQNIEKNVGILKQMFETGFDRMSLYRKIVKQVSTRPWLRDREMPVLLDAMRKDLKARHHSSHPLYVPRSQLEEYAATLLLTAMYRGRPDLTREWLPVYRAEIHNWNEGDLVDLVLDSALSAPEKFSKAAGLLSSGCNEAALLFTVGDLAQDAGEWNAAIEYYERALTEEPHEFPVLYLAVALLHEKQGRMAEAKDALERCVDKCRLAPERNNALDWIKRIERKEAEIGE